MFLRKLTVINFKNIAQASLDFPCRISCFAGSNGAGKTNIADAVYYLSMCKSSVGMTDNQNIAHGTDFFMSEGHYLTDSQRAENILCSYRRNTGKTVKRNGKEYEKISGHIGVIPVVMVSPADSLLITDSADERRRFINMFISQLDREYLSNLVRYNKLLSERNSLLKNTGGFPDDILDVIDERISILGDYISGKRASYCQRMAPLIADFYRTISDDRESVEFRYSTELTGNPLRELLAGSREKDRMVQYTTKGVHRDELKMKIGGFPIRKYGSQGQQKSFLLALKLAQYSLLLEDTGEKPLLILDDVFDKLDSGRVEQIISIVSSGNFGQIFITDCDSRRIRSILDKTTSDYSIFEVDEGKITMHEEK